MIESLKSYPAMMDSGMEWLGEVPEHWKVEKLRSILRSSAKRNRSDLPLLSVVREKGVIVRDVSDQESNHNFIPDDLSNYKVVLKGQFAMNKMKAWQGSYGVSKHDGIVSPAYYVFNLKDEVCGGFFNAAIRSKAYIPFFTQASVGVRIGQWDLSQNRMREIPFAVPSRTEQNSIVRFLNYIDRRIQKYINAKKKLIKLLEEQKQAIINQAVTKGLNPDVKMKPSGIEWLGEIPEHWLFPQIKTLSSGAKPSITNGPFGSNLLTSELTKEGVPVIYIRDISKGFYNRVSTSYVSPEKADELRSCSVQPGDVLIAKVGDPPGMAAVYPDSEPNAVITQDVVRLRPNSELVNSSFFALFLNSCIGRDAMNSIAIESTRKRFSLGSYKRLSIPLPPIDEQGVIINALAGKLTRFSEAASSQLSSVTLLREYRTRLISDVVTGKIDVREIAAQLPDEDDDFDVPELDDALDEAIDDLETEVEEDE